MKSLFATVAAATILIGVSVSGASAFGMNVPKSVIVAALEAPTMSSAERSVTFPPLTFLSTTVEFAARVRNNVIDVFAPGILSDIGAAYHRALGAPATSSVAEVIAI